MPNPPAAAIVRMSIRDYIMRCVCDDSLFITITMTITMTGNSSSSSSISGSITEIRVVGGVACDWPA